MKGALTILYRRPGEDRLRQERLPVRVRSNGDIISWPAPEAGEIVAMSLEIEGTAVPVEVGFFRQFVKGDIVRTSVTRLPSKEEKMSEGIDTSPTLQRHRVLRLAATMGRDGFTRRDVAVMVGCYELASRVGELEAEGVTFSRERESGMNMFGDNVRFTRYRLIDAPQEVLAIAGVPWWVPPLDPPAEEKMRAPVMKP
jgi:hypothetical protein